MRRSRRGATRPASGATVALHEVGGVATVAAIQWPALGDVYLANVDPARARFLDELVGELETDRLHGADVPGELGCGCAIPSSRHRASPPPAEEASAG
jgi:hypothetical protein